jgi:hypothetical protein
VELLKELRYHLDEHSRKKGIDHHFQLTIAAPCGASNYEKLHASAMNRYLDFWNLMVRSMLLIVNYALLTWLDRHMVRQGCLTLVA